MLKAKKSYCCFPPNQNVCSTTCVISSATTSSLLFIKTRTACRLRILHELLCTFFVCKTCIPCTLHGNCETLRADVHVAGPPCIHYSPMGLRLGLAGKTNLCFLCWVAQRRRLRERAILHENVPEFKVEILERFFSDLYSTAHTWATRATGQGV